MYSVKMSQINKGSIIVVIVKMFVTMAIYAKGPTEPETQQCQGFEQTR